MRRSASLLPSAQLQASSSNGRAPGLRAGGAGWRASVVRGPPEKLVIKRDELFYKLCESSSSSSSSSRRATAAGDVWSSRTPRRPSHVVARASSFKPILATSWCANKVNDVLLVRRLNEWKYAVVDFRGATCRRPQHATCDVSPVRSSANVALVTPPPIAERSIAMSVSVYVWVCLSAIISSELRVRSLPTLWSMLPI